MLSTPRLLLRRWCEDDREPFARINADRKVMEFMPALLTRAESDAMVDRIEAHFGRYGFGPFAVELRSAAEFIGFVGLFVPSFEAHFTPCVEIGWRLDSRYWGHGFATEAATAVLEQAFGAWELGEVVSFTVAANLRSRRVMEKLGMKRDPADDFDHPKLPINHPLRRHVLYRIRRPL
ncbi:MAG: GNAT family N-acetyltransferase, partial [Acidobacteriaceae bacterium]|nr:GNAT family N-acetyltransferase [Acidobacteriaceae bacterium]